MAIMRVNYSKVIAQAKEINSVALDIKKQYDELRNLEQEISGAWQGEAADAFKLQLNVLSQVMSTTF